MRNHLPGSFTSALLAVGALLVVAASYLHDIARAHGVYDDLAANANTAGAWNWLVLNSWHLTWITLIGGAALIVIQQVDTNRQMRDIKRRIMKLDGTRSSQDENQQR